MFEHGIARAGYIEAPRDPDLAYEFLSADFRVAGSGQRPDTGLGG